MCVHARVHVWGDYRLKEATALCESTLALVPHCCPLLKILSKLHAAGGDADGEVGVWLSVHRLRPHDARVFYSLCKCLHAQVGKYTSVNIIYTHM